MTYLVQKTNMFKQKMKIDDNIICYKMLTVQVWCICTWTGLPSIVLKKIWWITLDCLAITFNEGRCAYLMAESVTLTPLCIFGLRSKHHLGKVEHRNVTWEKGVLVLSGLPGTTTQKCSRAETALLCETCRLISAAGTVRKQRMWERCQVHILSPTVRACCQLYIWPGSTLWRTGTSTKVLLAKLRDAHTGWYCDTFM